MVKSGNALLFRYWGRKVPGEMTPEIIQFTVTYQPGPDEYDILIEHYDTSFKVTQAKALAGMMPDNFEVLGLKRDVLS